MSVGSGLDKDQHFRSRKSETPEHLPSVFSAPPRLSGDLNWGSQDE